MCSLLIDEKFNEYDFADDASGHKKTTVHISMVHSMFKLLMNVKENFEKGLNEQENKDGIKFDSSPYLSC